MNKTPIAAAISIALANGSFFISTPALSQETAGAEPNVIEEIVATGSRIRKDVFTSSTPMDVIDVEEASIQGIANVGELLRRNTAAAGSPQVTAATTTEFVQNGGVGANTLSLRGLGANRTLVLINGRRPGPAGTRGAVSSFDLNILPLAAIQRVEILKDGASSIYGSDAVAGVINIITKTDDGGTLDGFVSQPSDDGGEHSRLSASWGKSFNRGYLRVTADYNKQEELARGDRDYFTCGNEYIFDQTTGERGDITDPRTEEFHCSDTTWGHIWIYNYGQFPGDGRMTNLPVGPTAENFRAQYDYDGDLAQYIPGYDPATGPDDLTLPPGWFPTGHTRDARGVENANHPFQDEESLIPETENTTLFVEGSYEISDSTELYGEFLINRRTTYLNDYRQYWSFAEYTGNYSFYYGPGVGSDVVAAQGWFGYGYFSPTAITDWSDSEITVDYNRFVAGLRGDFGNSSWGWDLSGSYNVSDGDYWEQQIYQDSIFDTEWTTGADSCVGNFSSVRGVPCIDIPWFSPDLMAGIITPEQRDFLLGTETGNTKYTQWSIDGFATGEAFQMPAGPLGLAVGFHYREDEIDDLPGEITLAGNTWGATAAGNTVGKDTATAVFAEIDVPLLNDKTAFQNLTLNASARYTDVDSYGDDTTWKVGINWQIIDSVRIRANKGTSFRTPALFELYLADQTSFISPRGDPCEMWGTNLASGAISQTQADNCAADQSSIGGPAGGFAPDYTGGTITPTVFTGGGLGVLEAETSESTTIGMIWTPAFTNLSVSIDYFDIRVENEVDVLGANNIQFECYASQFGFAFGDTDPLCHLFDRTNANDGVDNIIDNYLNIALQDNRGFDYSLLWNTAMGGRGDLSIELQATRQLEDFRALSLETGEELNGRIGQPEWVAEYNVSFVRGPWSVYYGGNYIGTSDTTDFLSDDETISYFGTTYDAVMHTDVVIYHNLSLSYAWEDQGVRALIGVANFTGEDPPQVTTVGGTAAEIDFVGNSAFYSQYDWFGRRFFANLTWNFQ